VCLGSKIEAVAGGEFAEFVLEFEESQFAGSAL
jgi:hypothetical protein